MVEAENRLTLYRIEALLVEIRDVLLRIEKVSTEAKEEHATDTR